MPRITLSLALIASALLIPMASAQSGQSFPGDWTFAVSGDSRNCGDFVMPAIAARVRAEHDAFYWHLGDFRWISQPDQDLVAMLNGKDISKQEYRQLAWDDFLSHQAAAFAAIPVFLGRGNHDAIPPLTRQAYIRKFSRFLDRPEVESQRQKDGSDAAPVGPWYHWIERGVDFITLDNSTKDEFSDEQLHWLRAVLDHDLAPGSGVNALVVGAHEALPHSTGAEHAMDDWDRGERTGELVYHWLYDAQAAGKHVYWIASHSHYYSPDIYDTSYWRQHTNRVVPGLIIGSAGAHRYTLPKTARKGAKTMIYGLVQGTVHPDGRIDFALKELSEQELINARWPDAPPAAIHECYIHNGE
ncbi:MAG TPA: hypothetical protein VHA37_00285 [Candidatus Saccharimonadales bacterium]|nr:hypothetical protein [Candidatus Saccharimonadales bacterium]